MPKTPNPSSQDLKQLAKKRLHEAEVLLANGKYEGTVYLCGYAIELALKARTSQGVEQIQNRMGNHRKLESRNALCCYAYHLI